MTLPPYDIDPEDDAVPLPDPLVVIAEIERGAPIEPSRLGALSEPSNDTLRACLAMWPRIPAERRREVLAALEHLADEQATLDFHRVQMTAMRDPDPATRMLAVHGLLQEEKPEYVGLLLQQLRDDPVDSVRAEVAKVLGSYVVAIELGLLPEDTGESLVAGLRDTIENIDEPDEVRGRALEALGALSDEATGELISEQYEIGSHRMRVAALRAMGRNASEGWLDLLIYHFDDDDPEIRAAAAEATGALLVDEAVTPLILLAQEDRDEEVQVAAIHALGEIANDEAERVLNRWLSERGEPAIQEAVREALGSVHLITADLLDDRDGPPEFDGQEPIL
ncbi:MAG: HEAT repeat domain-containing protein [Chloroflexi bacterium]|nr:HEAT repeat domain-containing protein [Chloroflexota bacterium]MQC25441.1 hypothetical protein [Chloroflexota bacterium]MQC48546.1 hypothetical protein [Chloroflexota bacterium]